MGRRKKSSEDSAVVEQKSAPIASRKKVTKAGLAKLQEKKFLENSEEVLDLYFDSLKKGLRDGDGAARRIVAEMYDFASKKNGISFTANLIQNNVNKAGRMADDEPVSNGRYFDSIIRRLDARDSAERNLAASQQTISVSAEQ